MSNRCSLLVLLLFSVYVSVAPAQSTLETRNRSLIVGTWGHVSMDVVYQFHGDGTFRYVISSSDGDSIVLCEGWYKVKSNHLTVQNTGGRVLKGRQYGQACNDDPEITRISFSDANRMTLTDEDTGYSDQYSRKRN